MTKKILYLMHVDWNWIKQRPQYIAEGLSKNYEVLIVYPYYMRRSHLTKNKRNGLKLRALILIPFANKIRILHVANNLIKKIYINAVLELFKPDYIWITFPDLYRNIPLNCKCKIIYDCMDDAGEFDNHSSINSEFINLEVNLIRNSSVIFVSSKHLMDVIINREQCRDKIVLIRNAFGGNRLKIDSQTDLNINKVTYKICYVGTISSWFDFDSLYFCVQHIENIEFHIIGPVGVSVEKWSHERIVFHRPVNHDELYNYVKDFDCMIMPFRINKLIMSVDPVKLYEYVNYNKPIISVYYKEIERFSKYVSFYSTKEELLDIIKKMINIGFITKYDEKQREKLLSNNSWENRTNKIIKNLEKIDSKKDR